MIQTFETLQLPDSDQHGAALHHYLVTSYSPNMAKEIYGVTIDTNTAQFETDPLDSDPLTQAPLLIAPLYIETRLSELISYSPFVVKINNGDKLCQHYQQNAINTAPNNELWSGIIVTTTMAVSFKQLLSHLRQRMMIIFDNERQAVFHYQNPTVAHYFFGEANQQDTAAWLGPISQINWFAYSASAHHNSWCRVINDKPTPPFKQSEQQQPGSEVWTLTVSQQRALEIKYDDKLLAQFFNDNDIPSPKAKPNRDLWLQYRRYINQAQSLGLETTEHLNQYLSLCRQYSDSVTLAAQLPALQTLSNAEKISALQHQLSKDFTYVS